MRIFSLLGVQAQPPPAPAITTSFIKEAGPVTVPAWPDMPGMLEQWLFALQANVVSASSFPDIAKATTMHELNSSTCAWRGGAWPGKLLNGTAKIDEDAHANINELNSSTCAWRDGTWPGKSPNGAAEVDGDGAPMVKRSCR